MFAISGTKGSSGLASVKRDDILIALKKFGIETRPLICGNIGRHPFWTKKKGNCILRNADIIHDYGLYLPNHYNLVKRDIIFICQKFNQIAIPKFFN